MTEQLSEHQLKQVEEGIDLVIRAKTYIQNVDLKVEMLKSFSSALNECYDCTYIAGVCSLRLSDNNLFTEDEIKSLNNYILCMIESKLDTLENQKASLLEDLGKIFLKKKENNESN